MPLMKAGRTGLSGKGTGAGHGHLDARAVRGGKRAAAVKDHPANGGVETVRVASVLGGDRKVNEEVRADPKASVDVGLVGTGENFDEANRGSGGNHYRLRRRLTSICFPMRKAWNRWPDKSR
jgi:hypothetical protein